MYHSKEAFLAQWTFLISQLIILWDFESKTNHPLGWFVFIRKKLIFSKKL